MRGEDGVLVRGRWRPSQSGHTGNVRTLGARGVAAHPLHIAPFASIPAPNTSGMNIHARASSTAPTAGREVEPPVLQDVGGLLGTSPRSAPGFENIQDPLTTSSASADRSPLVQFQQPSSDRSNTAVESTELPLQTGEEITSKWEKLGLLVCYVCCGMEKLDDDSMHPRVVPNMEETGGVRYPRVGHVGL